MMLDTQPASAEDLFALGNAFSAREEFQDAFVCFDRVRVLRPFDARVYNNLGATLARLNRLPEAVVRYREASVLDPNNADIHHNLGCALEQLHRLQEAVVCYRRATELNPRADVSYNNMANSLHALGLFDEAHEAYRHAIRIAPDNTVYYRNFVQSKRLTVDDPCFIMMEQLLQRAQTLSLESQAQLHFAYGQALSDVGRDAPAFEHFLQANALKRPSVPYNEAMTFHLFDNLPKLLTADLLKAKRDMGDPSDAPIFIVGMPRSGSTLIEQILASHPQVFGAGECPEFARALASRTKLSSGEAGKIDIEALEELSSEHLAPLGADYLQRILTGVHDGKTYSRVADKYPFNFIYIGLIHLALPNARFIHSRRTPVETCLSNFSRLFHDVPFSYDLGELGRYYRAYDTLMTHWQQVLPEGVMIDVQYEELVTDLEPTVRRMLEHCGLEWDARCLSFHDTQRQVITASASQVRQPLFRTSLERWRPTRQVLQPLFDGLGPELSRIESQDYQMSAADPAPDDKVELYQPHLLIDKARRAAMMGQKPGVIWMTGFSGAGKSTLANLLEVRLAAQGRHTYLIDGDNLRGRLSRDLGFSDSDRSENIRRAAEVARLMVDAGLIVIVALISPLQADRQLAREVLGGDEFIEIFVDVPLEVAEARDPKGLYKKARAGQLKRFTGIDSPYEAPLHADLVVDAHRAGPEIGVGAVLDLMARRGLLGGVLDKR